MVTPIRSVDELCTAAETILKTYLVNTMTGFGYTTGAGYKPIKTWQQVPTVTALSTADLPGIAIVASDTVGDPIYQAVTDTWLTTWRISTGLYVRGGTHDETQARVRNYIAAIRATYLTHKSLGGYCRPIQWKGEGYNLLPARNEARTIAAGACTFDATVEVTTKPLQLDLPTVATTQTTVTAHPGS
ncbi:hypothetical protein Back2_17870 [Nocardioides baekrokdamisoli]|uniref:Uncharacterized protein n=1 Tax=Nocardioides baekrokdamisoli TaxID=1804624 RepID=A0A3G9IET3_9ACTN|nr:hypothetical protein [Nocardioides baekrokdamisoli]BBH17500.1 hypothetical protein Back2_17870 [Nocardioides baekrokdamisoli]